MTNYCRQVDFTSICMKVSLRSNICEMNKTKSHIFTLVTVVSIAGIVGFLPVSAMAKKGVSPEKLYQWVSEDTPVVVWCTIDMADRYEISGWYTENGDYVEWSQNDHGAVLIGYDENQVTIADPITGVVEYDKAQFESVFKSRGSQCVILV